MPNKITSKDNQLVKHFQKLIKDKKYRYQCSEFVIEGPKQVAVARDIAAVFIREDYQAKLSFPKNTKVYIIDDKLFNKITDSKTAQGIAAICKFENKNELDKTKNYLLLDRLQDPGNLGTIIRTAVAFGYQGIILTGGTADPYAPKVVRATMGTIFDIDILFYRDINGLAEWQIIAADLIGQQLDEIKLKGNYILCIGNESQGLSAEVKSLAQTKVKIPISNKVESLNAAIAMAVISYHLQSLMSN